MRVGIVPSDIPSCEAYRARYAAEYLHSQGQLELVEVEKEFRVRVANRRHGEQEVVGMIRPPEVDVLVLTRGVLPGRIVDLLPILQANGIGIVVDVDDDYERLPPRMLRKVNPSSSPLYNWRHVKRACQQADVVTVSTPALARYSSDAIVLPNRVPRQNFRKSVSDGATVGWSGTVDSHPGALRTTRAGVAEALRENDAKFLMVGSPDRVREELGLDHEPESTGLIPMNRYFDQLARIDVGIAPLENSAFAFAKCLDVSTPVMTDSGIRPIGEINEADRVWYDDQWRTVEAVEHAKPTEGIQITTSLGLQLSVTPNHRLRNGDIWRCASELRVGNMLDLAGEEWPQTVPYALVPWPAESRRSRGGFNSHAFETADSGPRIVIDERWGRLLGLFAGDGSAGGKTAVCYSMDGQDADLIEQVMNDWRAVGLNPTTETVTTWAGEILRCRSIRVSSSLLVRVFEYLGLLETPPGRETRKRVIRVPEVIWTSPRSVVAAFLAGLFEADATVGRSGGVTLCTKERSLANDVQRLLVGFGIFAHVVGRRGPRCVDGRDYSDRLYWYVSLRRASLDVFAREIGLLSARKRARLDTNARKPYGNAYRPMPTRAAIVSMAPCVVRPVDLQVEGGIFAAAGIVSHNSALKPLEFMACGAAWVASPTPEYEKLSLELQDWCFRRSEEPIGITVGSKSRKWRSEILRRLQLPTRERRAFAQAFVRERHLIDHHAHLWAESWKKAMDRCRASRRA